jgi:Tfp pilus assembly protein PilN
MRYNTSVVNLLPIKNQRTVAWEHRRRILLVVLVFGICSVVLLGLFTAPSWIVTTTAIGGLKDQLVATKTLVDLQRKQSGTEVLTELQVRSELLQGVLSQRSLTAILQDVMPRIPTGVSVHNISYGAKETEVSVTLTGRAQTRTALIALGDSLRSSPLFSRVDVPVSSLARSTDINFVITLVLTAVGNPIEYLESSTTTATSSSVRTVNTLMSSTTQGTLGSTTSLEVQHITP